MGNVFAMNNGITLKTDNFLTVYTGSVQQPLFGKLHVIPEAERLAIRTIF